MTRHATPKLAAYAVLSSVGLIAALVLGRAELVALTAPFLLALVAGLGLAVPPHLTSQLELDRTRVLEGDPFVATLTLTAATAVDSLEIFVRIPDGIALDDTSNPRALRLARDEHRVVEIPLRARLWGAHVLGPTFVRARDGFGLLEWESTIPMRPEVRVYPREAALRRLVRPREPQLSSGNEVSRRRGEGIEFADMRPWVAGDLNRRVNWRVSARRGELWVNESHPERNIDVIVFLDAFAEARIDGAGTLDLAARATTAIANAYVGKRDRIGLISFGGILRWLTPGQGAAHLYRLIDALLDTEVVLSYYWKDIDVIPRRTLPPNALVIALSPLLDARSIGALLDLRARGHDLAVIDVTPIPFTPRPPGGLESVAYDVWAMRREALRQTLRHSGVAVAEWRPGDPLHAVLEEVMAFRRNARSVRA